MTISSRFGEAVQMVWRVRRASIFRLQFKRGDARPDILTHRIYSNMPYQFSFTVAVHPVNQRQFAGAELEIAV
jgi:hypothetical protein